MNVSRTTPGDSPSLNQPPRQSRTANITTPTNITAASGMQYFKQVVITWSIRSRGSVQRTHIITVTPSMPLRIKFSHAQQVGEVAGDPRRFGT